MAQKSTKTQLASRGSVGDSELDIEGSRVTGAFSSSGMTVGTNKVLGRTSSGTGPVEELDIDSLIPAQDELVTDVANLIPDGAAEDLTYSSNGDTNGVFYKIGQLSNAGVWQNPYNVVGGVVGISNYNSGADFTDFTNRTAGASFSSGLGTYVCWDLGLGRALVLNRYTMRQSSDPSYAPYAARNWKIQGSNDVTTNDTTGVAGATWVDLDVRLGDTSLTTANQYYSPVVTGVTTAYRWIRMIITNPTVLGVHYHPTSEWEFYGAFSYPQDPASPGFLEFSGTLTGEVRTAGSMTSTVTGNQDDFNFVNSGIIFMNNASAVTFRGFLAGYSGKRLTIVSIGADSVTINHQDANSTAANRIITSTGSALVLAAGTGRADLVYDTTNSRWRAWSV